MSLSARWQKHTLQFRFEAGTSRGVLTTKDTWFLILWENDIPSVTGIGECGPLKGLSPDDSPQIEEKLEEICQKISSVDAIHFSVRELLIQFDLYSFPSVLFGLETALLDLRHGGKRMVIPSAFSSGTDSIPINGLVWMGDETFMREQIEEKIRNGFNCIKLKIGAIDFETEIRLIESIRKHFSPDQMMLRVDANGAFGFEEAKEKLAILSHYQLHSIEQPIRAGQQESMKILCNETPLPIALDEELIGIKSKEEKKQLLDFIQPQFIILKPTLVGGLEMSREWIQLAEERNIGWWITSALESNIGLNAVSQLTASLTIDTPQGLGTGQLYHNNIPSPLTIREGRLFYDSGQPWDLRFFS